MPLNPSGAISLGGPVTGQSIAVELGLSPTASISLNQTNVRTLAQVPSGTIIMPTNFYGKSASTNTQKAIFGFGGFIPSGATNVSNLVSNTGVVATDTPGVGSSRSFLAGATYGVDKGILGFGFNLPTRFSTTNLVSNTGVVAANSPGVGTARSEVGAAGYGGDKAIYGFGAGSAPNPSFLSMTNLVSNTGVVAGDTPGVGTARNAIAATSYGGDKGIFGFGRRPSPASTTRTINLVSNTGVVAASTSAPGRERRACGAATYGGDKAIFAYGTPTVVSVYTLVSNTGVVAADTPGVGTAREFASGSGYGGDKAIFGFGLRASPVALVNVTNLVSNTGVVAADSPGVGTARYGVGAAGYSLT
jgi:hypothetical protein